MGSVKPQLLQLKQMSFNLPVRFAETAGCPLGQKQTAQELKVLISLVKTEQLGVPVIRHNQVVKGGLRYSEHGGLRVCRNHAL